MSEAADLLAHSHGRFRHDPVLAPLLVRGERLIGGTAHYVIGIAISDVVLATIPSWPAHL